MFHNERQGWPAIALLHQSYAMHVTSLNIEQVINAARADPAFRDHPLQGQGGQPALGHDRLYRVQKPGFARFLRFEIYSSWHDLILGMIILVIPRRPSPRSSTTALAKKSPGSPQRHKAARLLLAQAPA